MDFSKNILRLNINIKTFASYKRKFVGFIGNITLNVAPNPIPGLCACIVLPCILTMLYTIAKPNPSPANLRVLLLSH